MDTCKDKDTLGYYLDYHCLDPDDFHTPGADLDYKCWIIQQAFECVAYYLLWDVGVDCFSDLEDSIRLFKKEFKRQHGVNIKKCSFTGIAGSGSGDDEDMFFSTSPHPAITHSTSPHPAITHSITFTRSVTTPIPPVTVLPVTPRPDYTTSTEGMTGRLTTRNPKSTTMEAATTPRQLTSTTKEQQYTTIKTPSMTKTTSTKIPQLQTTTKPTTTERPSPSPPLTPPPLPPTSPPQPPPPPSQPPPPPPSPPKTTTKSAKRTTKQTTKATTVYRTTKQTTVRTKTTMASKPTTPTLSSTQFPLVTNGPASHTTSRPTPRPVTSSSTRLPAPVDDGIDSVLPIFSEELDVSPGIIVACTTGSLIILCIVAYLIYTCFRRRVNGNDDTDSAPQIPQMVQSISQPGPYGYNNQSEASRHYSEYPTLANMNRSRAYQDVANKDGCPDSYISSGYRNGSTSSEKSTMSYYNTSAMPSHIAGISRKQSTGDSVRRSSTHSGEYDMPRDDDVYEEIGDYDYLSDPSVRSEAYLEPVCRSNGEYFTHLDKPPHYGNSHDSHVYSSLYSSGYTPEQNGRTDEKQQRESRN